MQSLSLDLLALQLGIGVVEVEEDCALMKLLDKKLGPFGRRSFCFGMNRREMVYLMVDTHP